SGGPLRPSAISGGSLPSLAITSCVSCIRNGCFPRAVSSPLACQTFACHGVPSQRTARPQRFRRVQALASAWIMPGRFEPLCGGNGACRCGVASTFPWGRKRPPSPCGKNRHKKQKKMEIAVDTSRSSRLYTPHQRRRRRCWRRRSSLLGVAKVGRNQESRVSDTRRPEAKSDEGHDIAHAMSVL